MKLVMLLSLTLIGALSVAGEKANFDYPELLPASPITLRQAKEVLDRTETLKEEAGAKYEQIKKEKLAQLAGWVEYKKQIVEQGKKAIDACDKKPECVSQANKKLTDELSAAHEKIREVNTYFDKQLAEEKVVVDRKLLALTKVLIAAKNAVIVNAFQEEAQKENGKIDFVMESNFMIDNFTDAESAKKYLNQNVQDRGWMWNVSDNMVYTFASFYYRTTQQQNRLFLMIDLNKYQNYADVKAEILDTTSQNASYVFGLKRSQLLKDLLSIGPGSYEYGATCLGIEKVKENEKQKAKACAAVIKNDSVSLQ